MVAGSYGISLALLGHYRGGPAKVAVASSSLFGIISGSSVANVVSSGIVTIPLMKRAGFSPSYAGAVEAVSSNAGQITPPVMGATGAMFVLGSLREILGNGTLFDGADALLGSWAKVLRIEVFHTDTPFLLAMLPPGAFIGLGMMLAIKYLIDEKRKRRAAERSVLERTPEKAS